MVNLLNPCLQGCLGLSGFECNSILSLVTTDFRLLSENLFVVIVRVLRIRLTYGCNVAAILSVLVNLVSILICICWFKCTFVVLAGMEKVLHRETNCFVVWQRLLLLGRPLVVKLLLLVIIDSRLAPVHRETAAHCRLRVLLGKHILSCCIRIICCLNHVHAEP